MIVIKLWRFLMNTFDLDSFFPKDKLQLIKVEQTKETIHIYLKSITKSCVCPKCGQSTEEYHGTYVRHVQDLPILEKMFSYILKRMNISVQIPIVMPVQSQRILMVFSIIIAG